LELLDPLVFGQRLRHLRRKAGLTLDELGGRVGRQAPYLSQLENGRKEPKLSLVNELARALGCPPADLLDASAPSRRAELEVAIERLQADPRYRALRLPHVRPSTKVPDDFLEHLVRLGDAVVAPSAPAEAASARRADVAAADPGGSRGFDAVRVANAALREEMSARDNYYPDIEAVASKALAAVGHTGLGAISERTLTDLAGHFGFTIARVQDLPRTARSVTDLEHRVVYIGQRNDLPTRAARSVVLQTLGHFALGHTDPVDIAEYLRQRVEANYFAGALLAPEPAAVDLLATAKAECDISAEDLKEIFYISYEMAAHRVTNLATVHLDIPVHFLRSDEEGVIWKAYGNDDVPFPADEDGVIEGQRLCREWGTRQVFGSDDSFALHYQYTDTAAGAFWCVTHVEADRHPLHAVTLGTTAEHAKWFRGHGTERHSTSRCPDPACCGRPALAARWEGKVWPSARDRSHVMSGQPFDSAPFTPFPGVDMTDVHEFLERHA
jgi:XRE family transcriptional regulator, fatty acid utilization regulator